MPIKKQTPDGREGQQRWGKQHPTCHPTPEPLPREHPDHNLHLKLPGFHKRDTRLNIQAVLHRHHHPNGEQPPPQSIPHRALTKSYQQNKYSSKFDFLWNNLPNFKKEG